MQQGVLIIYQFGNGTEIQVNLDNNTVWADTNSIANVFGVNRPAVVKHIQNIY